MGVSIQTLIAGDNQTYPRPGDTVHIHYTGKLDDGRTFDSSHRRGHPFTVKIGTGLVISGWDEGVLKMSLGETAILTASPDYAYGSKGVPPLIPPNSTLTFEMELLKVDRGKPDF
ncbi:peptidyl-prolyl cis-trans isomerase [Cylindrobasidium torrendii FP15055 ss-10]|uniref:peptidylprolyl isomerase n=1 Tax=Cylindrobasidium torrendii FP15055 ss-10 TaxID=1314674 RepID=A0A0D7BN72_9AGAR|nr:peptidyl-prolyl cis-trans isomerase [Cylindrobasidium torrendii FP15055 ss-10]